MANPSDTSRSAASVALEYLAALTAADPDLVTSLVTDDFVNEHTSALGDGCVGREEYRRRLPRFFENLPGLAYEAERTISEGDRTVVPYRLRATSDGHPIDIRGVMVIEVRDGAVSKRTDYWDGLTVLRRRHSTDGLSDCTLTVAC